MFYVRIAKWLKLHDGEKLLRSLNFTKVLYFQQVARVVEKLLRFASVVGLLV